jgi:hypothetical protein
LHKYAPRHNPTIFFDDFEDVGGVWSSTSQSARCLANDVPAGTTGANDMSAFEAALASGDVPRFSFVVPNVCEDGHDNRAPQGNEVTEFDGFVVREVTRIESSAAQGSSRAFDRRPPPSRRFDDVTLPANPLAPASQTWPKRPLATRERERERDWSDTIRTKPPHA